MRLSRLCATATAVALVAALAVAAEREAGLKVGDAVPAFDVKDVTGPSKGRTLCYR